MTRRRSRITPLVSSVAAIALFAAGGVVLSTAPAVAAETGDVTGRAFRDFNANGAFDDGNVGSGDGTQVDAPLAGVTVTVTDASGAVRGTAVTADDGTYDVRVADAVTADLRVQFTLSPEQEAEGYAPNAHGADNGTSVQFVTLEGGSASADFAAGNPDDFSQANPPLVMSIQYTGVPSNPENADRPAVVALPWDSNFASNQQDIGDFPDRVTLAT